MAGGEITEVGSLLGLPPPSSLTVTITIKGNSKTKDVGVVNWVLEKFVPEGMFMFKLVHVRPVITEIPTAVGSFRLSERRDDLVDAYRYEIDVQTEKKLLPYKRMCTRKKVQAEIVQIESDDIIDAISKEIEKSTVTKLVIGASSRGMFLRCRNVSLKIAESIPKFCTVYAVSKGKLSSSTHRFPSLPMQRYHALSTALFSRVDWVRLDFPFPFDSLPTETQTVLYKKAKSSGTLDSRFTSLEFDRDDIMTSTGTLDWLRPYFPELTGSGSIFPFPFDSLPTETQTVLYKKAKSSGTLDSRFTSLEFDRDDCMSSCPGSSDISRPSSCSLSSCQNLETDNYSWISHQATISDGRPEFSSESQMDVDLELEKLRIELRSWRKQYSMSQMDAIDSSKEVNDLNDLLLKEGIKVGEINYEDEEAKELAIQEEVKCGFARRAAEYVKECADRKAAEKNDAANKSLQEAKEKEKLENAQVRPLQQYQKFEWEDIVSATSNSSENLKIGSGAYGTVYKCSLHHSTGAVKALHSKETHRIKQFQQEVNDLNKRQLEEAVKLEAINVKEGEAKELAVQEKVKCEAARREAEYVKECAEREAAEKNEAANKALQEAKGKEKLENVLVGPLRQYQKFEWEDIVSATSNFSENLKIGYGAYGTVYKCILHYRTAAVKVLHSKEALRISYKQFQQELEVLSTIRHPHLLILLGACPDLGCLVYEYMENGSLEDRLLRRNNTPPIPWFQSYRITWEIASALVFLHSTNPQPIIHRNLKPANILLDQNFVSKIGDVGLSKMVDSDFLSPLLSTMCNTTGPVGTFCCIDPEYQRTGVISALSDVYAFGMVILQLVTGKSARALTQVVETAIEEGNLAGLFDPEAGDWPVEETKELAVLGCRCAKLRGKYTPNLRDQVLPALERLKDFADEARDVLNAPPGSPNHLISPMLENVMDYSCVAADGYTYDRRAIEAWLEENDDSHITNLPLPNYAIFDNPVFAV